MKAPLSSDKYDEFCPVWYKNGIVFCSNRNSSAFVNYSSSQSKSLFNINFIDTTAKAKWHNSKLFSKSLTSKMNDGPLTFNSTFDTIYFSRNQRIDGSLKDLSSMSNKLGVFSAVFTDRKWDKIQDFRFNSEWYNITAPCLSPDGSKLFFASDRPDGYGGSDIYYCQLKGGYWDDPVNLGPQINTLGNESYPFINESGELFFSSDGHGGLGGMDIFVTKQQGSGWYPPEWLDEPLNSKYNDFGIIADPLTNEGYFSSDRDKTIDIYHFKSNKFHFWFSEAQKENKYCFTLTDTGSIQIDKSLLKYEWDFGDGSSLPGSEVSHCYSKPGTYSINHDIIDIKTGKLFFRKLKYDIDLLEIDQPFITSPDFAYIGEEIELDGIKSFYHGYDINGYFWDFGDGITGIGNKVKHVYNKSATYDIRMGLSMKSITSGAIVKKVVSKKIIVLKSDKEKDLAKSANPATIMDLNDIRNIENIKVRSYYSAANDLKKEAMFQVVILNSPDRITLSNSFFRNIPSKYRVIEVFNSLTNSYAYVVDEQMTLMAAFPAYKEMLFNGYNQAMVRINVLKEQSAKEFFLVKKNFSLLTDVNFDANNRLTSSAYILLDQLVVLLNKYPAIKLELGVHTDNQGNPASLKWLSQTRAQVIETYLTGRGISTNRLIAIGYGSTRPVSLSNNLSDKRLNRRIDFNILD